MRVKDLIEKLSKCRPDSIVDVGSCGIFSVEELPGYYDGWYSYMDENWDNVTSASGSKVTIRSYDSRVDLAIDYIYGFFKTEELKTLPEEEIVRTVKTRFKCDFSDYSDPSQRKEKEDRFHKSVEEDIKEAISIINYVSDNSI